ncbi:hypothetical protein FRC03_006841 [Tulasnella sp. 419]|nr:hypothetical protein FRC03_006841 [Tulasnella sp. 419]
MPSVTVTTSSEQAEFLYQRLHVWKTLPTGKAADGEINRSKYADEQAKAFLEKFKHERTLPYYKDLATVKTWFYNHSRERLTAKEVPIALSSPRAVSASALYAKTIKDELNTEVQESLLAKGIAPQQQLGMRAQLVKQKFQQLDPEERSHFEAEAAKFKNESTSHKQAPTLLTDADMKMISNNCKSFLKKLALRFPSATFTMHVGAPALEPGPAGEREHFAIAFSSGQRVENLLYHEWAARYNTEASEGFWNFLRQAESPALGANPTTPCGNESITGTGDPDLGNILVVRTPSADITTASISTDDCSSDTADPSIAHPLVTTSSGAGTVSEGISSPWPNTTDTQDYTAAEDAVPPPSPGVPKGVSSTPPDNTDGQNITAVEEEVSSSTPGAVTAISVDSEMEEVQQGTEGNDETRHSTPDPEPENGNHSNMDNDMEIDGENVRHTRSRVKSRALPTKSAATKNGNVERRSSKRLRQVDAEETSIPQEKTVKKPKKKQADNNSKGRRGAGLRNSRR